jgi:ribosomal protein S18 acetylase RimI-like enzyme
VEQQRHYFHKWWIGAAHGYHAATFGWLVGEVVRRVSHKNIGLFLQEEIARPLGIDFLMGFGPEEDGRVATVVEQTISAQNTDESGESIDIAAIHNAAWQATGPSGENRQRHDAGRNADFFFQRLLAEIDGQIVAYAAYGEDAWNHTPGKYSIEIAVHPSYQRHGVGNALYRQIVTTLAARDPAPIYFTAITREDQPGALALLNKERYRLVMRSPMMRIDVAAFDATRFAAVEEKVRQAGITLHSMSELKQRDPDWIRHWYDLEQAINADHPMADRGESLLFETFAGYMNTPLVNTDAAFLPWMPPATTSGKVRWIFPTPRATRSTSA